MSTKTPYYSSHHSPTGTQGLWHTPGLQLPAYIQNVVKGVMKSGKSREQAIPIAIGRIRVWAAGGGNVTPEVRAAAAKAIAEWEALKAKAKGKNMSSELPEGRVELGIFNSLLHPRIGKGLIGGGRFSAGGSGAAKKKKPPKKKKKKPAAKKHTPKKSSSSSKSSSSTKKTTPVKKPVPTKPKPVIPGPVAPIAKPGQVQKYKTKKMSGSNTDTTAQIIELAVKSGVLSTTSRKAMAKTGVALPDGSFPIPTTSHVHKAIQAFGRCPPEKRPQLVNHVRKRARALGMMGHPKVTTFLKSHVGGTLKGE